MKQGTVKFHEKGQERALIELATQYPPKSALREFTTNSLDAKIPGIKENIEILLSPYEKRIIISDNGYGMKFSELGELPESIGYSKKAGMIDKRGEKALGLLAFGSIGNKMHVISKPYENNQRNFGYMSWEMKKTKEKINFEINQISSSDVESFYYGNFKHGTRIIIDYVDPHIMKQILTMANLKRNLALLYNPAIMKEDISIKTGKINRDQKINLEEILSIDYEKDSSIELINKTISVDISNEKDPSKLEVLLFLDPTASLDKPSIYSKDVLVYESLAELPEFSRSPIWTSGKISGYINDYFNRLILGREGIDRKRNAFKAWYEAINEIEKEISPKIEKSRKLGTKTKELQIIKEIFNIFSDVWKVHKRNEFEAAYTRSSIGEIKTVIGAEPSRDRKPKGGRKPIQEIREPTGRPPGPGTFVEDGKGYELKVSPKGKLPFACPQPTEFDIHERKLRSKVEDLGGPILFLNSAHEDYKSRVDLKDNRNFTMYVLDLIAKEASLHEMLELDKKGKLVGEKSQLVKEVLQKQEELKFNTLKKAGLK